MGAVGGQTGWGTDSGGGAVGATGRGGILLSNHKKDSAGATRNVEIMADSKQADFGRTALDCTPNTEAVKTSGG